MNPHAVTPFLPPQDEYRRVVDLATRLASTAFVPKGLRDQPESVLAAMLVGRELGIGALEALRSVHVIEGRPTESAELLHALVLRAGHDLYVAESTGDRCVVRYRRNGWPADRPDGEVAWTLADASAAGLAGKGTWQKYPRAMLRSRAVSEAVRQGFPDVVKGAGYVAEELDGPDDLVEQQAAGTVAVQDVTRVEPAATAQDLDGDVDEVEVRRALYGRARSAYKRVAGQEPDIAAQAWAALTMGLPGETAADVFRTADLVVLEQRVADLEACADDDGEPDDGTPAEPGPTPPDDDDDVVDAEVVADDDDACAVCGTTDDVHDGRAHADAGDDLGPAEEARPAHDEEPVRGVEGVEAPTTTDGTDTCARCGQDIAGEHECTDPDGPADLERQAWSCTNRTQALAILKGDVVTVDLDDVGSRYAFDLSDLSDQRRREVVRTLEEGLPNGGRKTVLAQVGRTTSVPGHAESPSTGREGPSGTSPPDGSATADSAGHGAQAARFEQPDGMNGREYATRVGWWRRYEAARAEVERSSDAGAVLADLDGHVRAQVGDPGGVMFVPLSALERLASLAEDAAERVRHP